VPVAAQQQQRVPLPQPQPQQQAQQRPPNILVIMGDDVGWFNIGAYHRGIMSGKTPNLDRLASEGMMFTDYYAEASCTAGRANFITGELPIRTGLTTVGQAGADVGIPAEAVTLAREQTRGRARTGRVGGKHFFIQGQSGRLAQSLSDDDFLAAWVNFGFDVQRLDYKHLDRDGCADPHPLNGKLPIRSSAIAAVPLFPRRGFAQSAACRSLVAGPTTAIDELPLRARAH
jgi:Sulfatase